jgi:alkylation response protein AidB-like acyl-CoA dehydrogenase
MVHGTPEQKRQFLPAMAKAEIRFCQGFSEPGAGSDLAGLQTRAVRDGDDYVINGQKTWTSGAQWSDWIHVLARTDPEAPKHRGITYFLVDMKTPGISVQPIVQMTGRTGFNSTFFDNVRVPRENILGEENRGWYAAATTLDFERSGMERLGTALANIREFVRYARETKEDGRRPIDKPGVGPMLADLVVAGEAGRWLCYRVAWLQAKGNVPNHEASMAKTFASDLLHRVAQAGTRLAGLYSQLNGGPRAPLDGLFGNVYVGSVPATISAGTNEIQRNIIAQRGLGLPR